MGRKRYIPEPLEESLRHVLSEQWCCFYATNGPAGSDHARHNRRMIDFFVEAVHLGMLSSIFLPALAAVDFAMLHPDAANDTLLQRWLLHMGDKLLCELIAEVTAQNYVDVTLAYSYVQAIPLRIKSIRLNGNYDMKLPLLVIRRVGRDDQGDVFFE